MGQGVYRGRVGWLLAVTKNKKPTNSTQKGTTHRGLRFVTCEVRQNDLPFCTSHWNPSLLYEHRFTTAFSGRRLVFNFLITTTRPSASLVSSFEPDPPPVCSKSLYVKLRPYDITSQEPFVLSRWETEQAVKLSVVWGSHSSYVIRWLSSGLQLHADWCKSKSESTRRHNPEDNHLQTVRRSENSLRCHTLLFFCVYIKLKRCNVLLTVWHRIVPERLMVAQMFRKFSEFYSYRK